MLMKRVSRPTALVLMVAVLACIAGMGLAVVAFGQSGISTDPTSGYTVTQPLSSYTTPTVPPPTQTGSSTTGAPVAGTEGPTTSAGSPSKPSTVPTAPHPTPAPTPNPGTPPSQITRPGPTHLAFTGGEPLIIGGAGVALMLSGLALQARRRARRVA